MEDGTFKITIEDAPSVPNLKIITIRGSFDKVASNQVDEKVLPIIEKGGSNIILDLSNLGYLSCIGMLCLIKYSTFLTDKKKLLKLVKPPKHVYNTLGAAGIARHFDMYDSVEVAMGSF